MSAMKSTKILGPHGEVLSYVIPDYTGYEPDPIEKVEEDTRERRYEFPTGSTGSTGGSTWTVADGADYVQRFGIIRYQWVAPSCAGHTLGSMVDSTRPAGAKPASGIGVWRDARRREGRLHLLTGTYLYLCTECVVVRGIETMLPNEDMDSTMWLGTQRGLDAEMDASDHHLLDAQRRRLVETEWDLIGALRSVLTAGPLEAQHAVGNGNDVGERYKQFSGPDVATLPEDFALGLDAIGTTGSGHAQHIVGIRVRNGETHLLYKNSWHTSWGLNGWYWSPRESIQRRYIDGNVPDDAQSLAGCAWVKAEVMTSRRARDFQVLMGPPS